MKNGKTPDPNMIHPIPGYEKEIYVKPTVTNPNIIVGDFTYIADSDFESHVTHHYEWNGDKLIIGRFCQIAAGVEFVMNGANHQMNAVSTFPFYTLEGWDIRKKLRDMEAEAKRRNAERRQESQHRSYDYDRGR
jgi:virginiamycin A acetyltransferase